MDNTEKQMVSYCTLNNTEKQIVQYCIPDNTEKQIVQYCIQNNINVYYNASYNNGNCNDFICFKLFKQNAVQIKKHMYETIDYYVIFFKDCVLLHRKKWNDIFLMDSKEYTE